MSHLSFTCPGSSPGYPTTLVSTMRMAYGSLLTPCSKTIREASDLGQYSSPQKKKNSQFHGFPLKCCHFFVPCYIRGFGMYDGAPYSKTHLVFLVFAAPAFSANKNLQIPSSRKSITSPSVLKIPASQTVSFLVKKSLYTKKDITPRKFNSKSP